MINLSSHPLGPAFYAFMEEAKRTPAHTGRIRTPSTLSHWRRGIEGFLLAVTHHGGDVTKLPDDVLTTTWVQTQGHRASTKSAIQLNLRMSAVRQFLTFLRTRGFAVPLTIHIPKFAVTTPASAAAPMPTIVSAGPAPTPVTLPASPDPTPLAAASAQTESPMSDVPQFGSEYLDDPPPTAFVPPAAPSAPVPTVQAAPPVIVQLPPPPTQPVPTIAQVQRAQQPRPMPRPVVPVIGGLSGAPPLPPAPAPSYSAPRSPPPPLPPLRPVDPAENPLAAYMHEPGYKLRIYVEDDSGEVLHATDVEARLLAEYGGPEPLLQKRILSRVLNVIGSRPWVQFYIAPVSPSGEVSPQRAPFKIVVPPTMQVAAASPTTQAAVASSAAVADAVVETLEPAMRAQREEVAQLAAHVRTPEPIRVTVPADAGIDAKLAALTATVDKLSAVVVQLASTPTAPPAPAAPAMNELLMAKLLDAVLTRNAPPPPPPTPTQSTAEMVATFAQLKDVFAPAHVSVDTSPLEDSVKELKQQLSQLANGQRGGVSGMAGTLRELKEVGDLFASFRGNSEPPSSLGALTLGALQKVVENPEPLANAVGSIIAGVAAARGGQAAPRPLIPPDVKAAFDAVLSASTEAEVAERAIGLARLLGSKGGVASKFGEQIRELLNADKPQELFNLLAANLPKLGYNVPPEKLRFVVVSIFNHLRKLAAQSAQATEGEVEAEGAEGGDDDGEEGDEEGDEEEGEEAPSGPPPGGAMLYTPPDMTVTVGGARTQRPQAAQPDDEDEEEEEAGGENEADEHAPLPALPASTPVLALPEVGGDEELGAGEESELTAAPVTPIVKARSKRRAS